MIQIWNLSNIVVPFSGCFFFFFNIKNCNYKLMPQNVWKPKHTKITIQMMQIIYYVKNFKSFQNCFFFFFNFPTIGPKSSFLVWLQSYGLALALNVFIKKTVSITHIICEIIYLGHLLRIIVLLGLGTNHYRVIYIQSLRMTGYALR